MQTKVLYVHQIVALSMIIRLKYMRLCHCVADSDFETLSFRSRAELKA